MQLKALGTIWYFTWRICENCDICKKQYYLFYFKNLAKNNLFFLFWPKQFLLFCLSVDQTLCTQYATIGAKVLRREHNTYIYLYNSVHSTFRSSIKLVNVCSVYIYCHDKFFGTKFHRSSRSPTNTFVRLTTHTHIVIIN